MQGQGYTINLVEIHPGLLPQVRHLHELHGLLQPVVLAPLFWIGGSDPALVRIPNILAVALLALATFQLGRHHFGNFVGTIAGLLVLSWRDLALDATLGGDDVGWALFSILTFLCFFRALETRRRLWIVSTGCAAALPTEAVLTSNPWFVAWAADRPAVSAPTNGEQAMMTVLDHYRVDWAIDGLPSFGSANVREILAKMQRPGGGVDPVRVFDGAQCDVYRLYRH